MNFIYDMATNTIWGTGSTVLCGTEKQISFGTDELVAGALKWVNMIRGEFDCPPLTALPRGIPSDPRQCPLALALWDIGEVEVACGRATVQHKGRIVVFPLSSDATIFVTSFDRRMLPELACEPVAS